MEFYRNTKHRSTIPVEEGVRCIIGYSSTVEVDLFLAQALTSARPDSTFSKIALININNVRDLNRIPNEIVEFFISTSDSQIDGVLSQQYKTPLKKCANGQWALDADINEYNQIVELNDATNLVPGDEIVIRDDSTSDEEIHIVDTVIDQNSVTTVSPILTDFSGDDVRVVRIQFPPPVNQISARYAAANIYDKYFAAQNAPNVSDYGNTQRTFAMGQLNDILNGRAILKCQLRIGDRMANPNLDSNYSLRQPPEGFDTGSRDMSDQK